MIPLRAGRVPEEHGPGHGVIATLGRAIMLRIIPVCALCLLCSGSSPRPPRRPTGPTSSWSSPTARGTAIWGSKATPRSGRPTWTDSPARACGSTASPSHRTSPRSAGLLTGWYPYRTGVADTYLGRAMMHPDEITLAEMLTASGYQTAIFGKWHFGDTTSATGRCALPAPATTQSPSGSPYPRPRARTPGASQRRPDEGRGAGRDAMHIRNRSH